MVAARLDSLQELADRGYKEALFALFQVYSEGKALPKDAGLASHYLHRAARAGCIRSMFRLMLRYRSGSGYLPKDDELAKYWKERLLEQCLAEVDTGDEYAVGFLRLLGYRRVPPK